MAVNKRKNRFCRCLLLRGSVQANTSKHWIQSTQGRIDFLKILYYGLKDTTKPITYSERAQKCASSDI